MVMVSPPSNAVHDADPCRRTPTDPWNWVFPRLRTTVCYNEAVCRDNISAGHVDRVSWIWYKINPCPTPFHLRRSPAEFRKLPEILALDNTVIAPFLLAFVNGELDTDATTAFYESGQPFYFLCPWVGVGWDWQQCHAEVTREVHCNKLRLRIWF